MNEKDVNLKKHRRILIGLLITMIVISFCINDESKYSYSIIYGFKRLRYIVQFMKLSLAGMLLIKGMEYFLKEGNRNIRKGSLFFGGAFLLNFFGENFRYLDYILFAVREFLHLTWPLLVTFIAIFLNKKCEADKKQESTKRRIWKYKSVLYWSIVICGVWFIENNLVTFYMFKKDVIYIIYMLVLAVLAWGKVNKKESAKILKKESEKESRQEFPKKSGKWLTSGIIASIAGGVMIVSKERFWEIMRSLANPMTAVSGGPEDVNWIAYRIEMISHYWKGNISVFCEFAEALFFQRGSVDLLMVQKTVELLMWSGIIIVVVLLTATYIKEYKFLLRKDENVRDDIWFSMIFYALILRCFMGLTTEFLLLATTRMHVPMLMGCEDIVLMLLYEFFADRRKADLYDRYRCIDVQKSV